MIFHPIVYVIYIYIYYYIVYCLFGTSNHTAPGWFLQFLGSPDGRGTRRILDSSGVFTFALPAQSKSVVFALKNIIHRLSKNMVNIHT